MRRQNADAVRVPDLNPIEQAFAKLKAFPSKLS
jgi:hypothetical protein